MSSGGTQVNDTTDKELVGGIQVVGMLSTQVMASTLHVGSHASTYVDILLAGAFAGAEVYLSNTPQVLHGLHTKR